MRAHGGRATPARRLLLGALVENPGQSSAEELAASVHARAPDVYKSTIYRNLDELERLNVVDRTRLGRGPRDLPPGLSHPWPPRLRTVQLDDRSPG
jgi:Fe2+ or Zn2+ uptake regulation protein